MKLETIRCASAPSLIDHLASVIDGNHKTTRAGTKRGGIKATAKMYGVQPQELSNVVNGTRHPSPRILAHEGLEAVTVYVPIKAKGE